MEQDSETGCLNELNIKLGQPKFKSAFDIKIFHMYI